MNNDLELSPGTHFVVGFTKFLAYDIGLSKFNTFLVFNLIGLIGLLIIAHCLLTLWRLEGGSLATSTPYVLLFLPGLSFWSSAIGKDAPAFLAVCLMAFAFLDIGHRKLLLAVSVGIMFLVRPHMAALMLIAAGAGLLFGRQVKLLPRLTLLVLIGAVISTAVPFAMTYTGLGSDASFDQLVNYISERQGANQSGSTSIDLAGMSLPEALFAFLFRPLFFDATGIAGFIVSVENLIYLVVFLVYCVPHLWSVWLSADFAKRANAVFVVLSLLVLAQTTANLGIATRQKTMLLPSLLVLAAMGARQAGERRSRRAPQPAPPATPTEAKS